MSIKTKVKTPEEDPEVKARREAAEARADATRLSERQDDADTLTRKLVRRFGTRTGSSLPSASGGSGFGGFNPFIYNSSLAQGVPLTGVAAPQVVRRAPSGASLVRSLPE
jgi:hypothetical protein